MSAAAFTIVQGDLEPDIEFVLGDDDDPKDVTDASAFSMTWKKPDGTVVEVDLESVEPAIGVVKYSWVAGDTDVIGMHLGQIVVTRGNGEQQTFPSSGLNFRWYVVARLE